MIHVASKVYITDLQRMTYIHRPFFCFLLLLNSYFSWHTNNTSIDSKKKTSKDEFEYLHHHSINNFEKHFSKHWLSRDQFIITMCGCICMCAHVSVWHIRRQQSYSNTCLIHTMAYLKKCTGERRVYLKKRVSERRAYLKKRGSEKRAYSKKRVSERRAYLKKK